MTRLSAIKADLDKEKEGVWLPFALGIEVRVGRSNSPEAQTWASKQFNNSSDKSVEVGRQIDDECLAKFAFKDIRGAEDIEYFDENKALELIQTKDLHELRSFLMRESKNAANFRNDEFEEAAKNFESSSDTT